MESEQAQLDAISALFTHWGASEPQARVMAAQLLKRAGQIAAERQLSLVEAVEMLLKQVVEARQTG